MRDAPARSSRRYNGVVQRHLECRLPAQCARDPALRDCLPGRRTSAVLRPCCVLPVAACRGRASRHLGATESTCPSSSCPPGLGLLVLRRAVRRGAVRRHPVCGLVLRGPGPVLLLLRGQPFVRRVRVAVPASRLHQHTARYLRGFHCFRLVRDISPLGCLPNSTCFYASDSPGFLLPDAGPSSPVKAEPANGTARRRDNSGSEGKKNHHTGSNWVRTPNLVHWQ